jgi:hypothetical protein
MYRDTFDNPVFRKDGSVSMKSTLAHQIKIPNSFMGRIEVYDKAQNEPNSLFLTIQALKWLLKDTLICF